MSKSSNEQLCALAQKVYTHAANLLLEYNSGFIRKTANKIFLKSNLAESDLIIEIGDLEQEGSIGLLKAIPSYDKSIGVKSLTYAAPFIRNAITELLNLKIIFQNVKKVLNEEILLFKVKKTFLNKELNN